MKKKLFLSMLFAALVVGVTAQTKIADFESGTFGEEGALSGSFSKCYADGNAVASFEIVDNPETTGLNTSTSVLKVVNKTGNLDWWGGLTMILEEPYIDIDEQNRYLHIMVKFQNAGNSENFHFAVFPKESEGGDKWAAITDAQSEWFDYVVDLKNVDNTSFNSLRAIRYLTRPDNLANQGDTVYIDEIILSNDPAPRVAYIEPEGLIANFEDGTLNAFTECVVEGNGVTSFEVVDNPETTGLNQSNKTLKVINGNGDDWGGLKFVLPEPIIASENRYIHIMMKFQNVGIQNFHFAVFSSDIEKWSLLTNAQAEWFDYVIDLNNIENTALNDVVALRYLPRSANYTNPGNVVYIDEIIVNNDPKPRGGYNQIEEATTIADFDDGSLNKLTCADDGGGVASFEVADNPDASDINTSSKALKLVTSASGDWWPGLLITFPKPVVVNAETRYLHIMMYVEESGQTYEFALNLTNQHYSGQAGLTAGWKDYVFDLGAYMGQKLVGFRHCTRVDGESNRNKIRYIDEIAVSGDPRPRGGFIDAAATIADFNDGTFNNLTCADDGGGVAAGSMEVADNPSATGMNTSEKSLKFVVGSTAGSYWEGLKISFPKVVFVTENTRYLHVMTYNTTNDQSYEFNVFANGENYMGEKTTKEGWEDHVIDLNGIMGQNVTGFRYATRIDNAKNLGKTRYIDEIIVNDDPNPRNITSGISDENAFKGIVLGSQNGITIQGITGEFAIYNIRGSLEQKGVTTGYTHVNMPKGVYLVKIGAQSYKVII